MLFPRDMLTISLSGRDVRGYVKHDLKLIEGSKYRMCALATFDDRRINVN